MGELCSKVAEKPSSDSSMEKAFENQFIESFASIINPPISGLVMADKQEADEEKTPLSLTHVFLLIEFGETSCFTRCNGRDE